MTVDANVTDMQVTTANTALTVNGTVDTLQADANVTVSGNGDIKKQTGSGQISVSVAGVSLDKTEIVLVEGSSEKLTATVEPTNATNKNVTWSSDHEAVATVDQNGTVTARNGGQAIITVTTADGSKTATCTVNVRVHIGVPVQSVGLNKTELALEVGKTGTLEAIVEPSDATNKNVTWSSSNSEVATVDNGVVTAVSAGTAIITVTTEDGAKTATCKVTVNAPQTVPVTGVTLDKTSLDLKTGDNTTLTATVNPESATNKDVTWISDKPEIAAVEGGTVTAKAAGTAIIAVTTVDGGKIATCKVTVTPKTVPVSGIQVQGAASIYVGDTTKLTATITPDGASNKAVTWDSQNKDIATVDQQGNVKALKAGTATITATAQDGSGISGSFVVTVQQADTTALKAKVTEAQALLDKTEVSAQNGKDVPPMKNWVVQQQKDDLQKAVNTANGVLQQSTLTSQNTVNDAYRDLQMALNAFLNAMKPGTMPNTPVPYSFWDLW